MANNLKSTLSRTGTRYARVFSDLNTGQKIVAVIGTGALLLGGFLVFRWISAPSYAPLFSNLSSQDAAAVTEQLDSTGVPYKLADGGSMIMVPRDDVYQTRIDLSADGIPEGSDGGYSILDDQGLSTSDFQEQTSYKRAMEGELAKTIQAIDGVDTAVVHLALPEKQVFSDNQQPTKASVLVDTRPGADLAPEQVQGIVHLVSSSIEGLDPNNVTVTDATGSVLTSPDDAPGTSPTTRDRQQETVEASLQSKLQTMLDRVVGPGNSTVQVNADLDFDATDTESTDYTVNKKKNGPSSESSSTETYQGPADGSTIGGVVGPDGQMDPGSSLTSGGASNYQKKQKTADTPVDVVHEHRQTAPGGIKSIHVGIALDSATTGAYAVGDIRDLVQDAIGITAKRGDTVRVVQMPFDRSAEDQATADIKAAKLAEQKAARATAMRTGGIAGAILLVLLLALFRARRHHRARQEATTYVVEQIRQEQAARAAAVDHTQMLALEAAEPEELSEQEQLRVDLDALIERQPEDVAVLLRGWLTERA